MRIPPKTSSGNSTISPPPEKNLIISVKEVGTNRIIPIKQSNVSVESEYYADCADDPSVAGNHARPRPQKGTGGLLIKNSSHDRIEQEMSLGLESN